MQKFHVVGMGPGSPEYILPAALNAVEKAEVLFGSGPLINEWAQHCSTVKETVPLSGSVDTFLDKLDEQRVDKNCAVLVTGDAGFYSLLAAIRRRFSPDEFIVIPGITAFQLACAKIGLPWQEYLLASAHGKSLDSMYEHLSSDRGAIILTDRKNNPQRIAEYLREKGWSDRSGWICKNIAKEDEEIFGIKLHSISPEKENGLCLMILQPASME